MGILAAEVADDEGILFECGMLNFECWFLLCQWQMMRGFFLNVEC